MGASVSPTGDAVSVAVKRREFEPIRLVDVELEHGVPPLPARAEDSRRYRHARTLVRLHGCVLGIVPLELGEEGLSAEEHAAGLWRSLGRMIEAHLARDGLPPIDALPVDGLGNGDVPGCVERRDAFRARAPFATVVIATRDRPEPLSDCLKALSELDYPQFEIVVVDNAPSSDATRDLVAEQMGHLSNLRYVREERPGLAVAHNRGFAESNGTVIAFTDDDVIVHRYWLLELARGIERSPDVGCVTGMILPAELETPAQVWAEDYWRFCKGFVERRFNLDENHAGTPLFPYAAGMFGSGANMAFRSDVLRDIGGFDPATGTGTPALGGDDLAAFFRVVTAGYTLVYWPRAIVKHCTARDYEELRSRAFGYGVGLAAYLTKTVMDEPARLPSLAVRAPRGIAYALSPRSRKNESRSSDYPSELKWLERRGMLYGPVAYLRSRRQARRWNGGGAE
jgi:GT2 family glycosyltransferase